jgi:hypothetical protein
MQRRTIRSGLVAGVMLFSTVLAGPANANHPVIVEGNCFGDGSGMTATGLQRTVVPPGTCGDHDGDGRIGRSEDDDGDNTFGTINAAVDSVAHNGRVVIVASGTFPEQVTLQPVERASLTLEAARGVDANIDAVVQGEAGGAERSSVPGIIIDGCGDCRVVVRNITTRNWTEGIRVKGMSHAVLENINADGNLNFGIRVRGGSQVVVEKSSVTATGHRKDANGAGEANPGTGIKFTKNARGLVTKTIVSGSEAAGIDVHRRRVDRVSLRLFDNNPNRILR